MENHETAYEHDGLLVAGKTGETSLSTPQSTMEENFGV